MSAQKPIVTVITITRGRASLLPRAIASVVAQVLDEPVEHLIVIDDCPHTLALLEKRGAELSPAIRWHYDARDPSDRSGPGRSAVIRNRGVRMARGDWIAFLDDDNEYESGHLASMLATARSSGVNAVHCWMQVFHSDGRPFLEDADPWQLDPERSREANERKLASGVRRAGSHIFRDRIDPPGTEEPVRTVDTGEWMLRRDLLLALPIPETYPQADDGSMFSEDDAYMIELLRRGEAVACSGRPTLRYYLGGYSNTGVFL